MTNSQSQDTSIRDLWGLAREKLSVEEDAAVSQIPSDSKLETLQHLRIPTEKKRNHCEDQRWKFELNGQKIILQDVAEKIIAWIDRFKQFGGIVVKFDQAHASPAMGRNTTLVGGWQDVSVLTKLTGRRLTVKQMPVAESQQMGALLIGVEKMTPLIGRCQIYEALYLKRNNHLDQEN